MSGPGGTALPALALALQAGEGPVGRWALAAVLVGAAVALLVLLNRMLAEREPSRRRRRDER